MTDFTSYEFEVTDQPPASRRKGGPGRKRSNPFDAAILESYNAGFEDETDEHPQGRWFKFRIKSEQLSTVKGQIRAAAQYNKKMTDLPIGSQVQPWPEKAEDGTETGMTVVWFRGSTLAPRNRKPNDNAGNESARNDEAANGGILGVEGEGYDD